MVYFYKFIKILGGFSMAENIRKAKYRIKNEQGDFELVYLETSADQVECDEERTFVSESEKMQFKENTVYTNDTPTVNALGGVAIGTTFDNMPVNEVLTKILYPYIKPGVSANTAPNNGGTFEKGDVKTVTKINAVVTKMSENITKIEYFDGSTSLGVKEGDTIAKGGTFGLDVNIEVSANKNFSVQVTDAADKTYSASTGSFSFVYPYYIGVCADGAEINEALVKGLTKKVEAKGSKSQAFTCDYQRMVFAYPKGYGVLGTIYDQNNFKVTDTFKKYEINVTGLDNTSQAYYVYVNDASTVTNFTMKFNY
jgi:hypothetical protein